MNEEEKHELLTILISEINIFEDRQANGQWLKEIVFSLPIIGNEKLSGAPNSAKMPQN